MTVTKDQAQMLATLAAERDEWRMKAEAFRAAWIALRPDVPRVGLFNHHADAVNEASRRAAIGGRRWRVRFEPNNRWWQIVEGSRLDWWHEMREAER